MLVFFVKLLSAFSLVFFVTLAYYKICEYHDTCSQIVRANKHSKILYIVDNNRDVTFKKMIKRPSIFYAFLARNIMSLMDYINRKNLMKKIKFLRNVTLFNVSPDYEDLLVNINDHQEIVQRIRDAHEEKKDLIIYIDSTGGNLDSSDSVCTALRTYHELNNEDKKTAHRKTLSITCVVDYVAQSAGTMIALSANNIFMSEFAVLGPTDVQIGVDIKSKNSYQISLQLYDDIGKFAKSENLKLKELELSELLTLRDNQNIHADSIESFKNLHQFKNATASNKDKLIKMFCKNNVPHHREFSVDDLVKVGIDVSRITLQQKQILKLLDRCNDIHEYNY